MDRQEREKKQRIEPVSPLPIVVPTGRLDREKRERGKMLLIYCVLAFGCFGLLAAAIAFSFYPWPTTAEGWAYKAGSHIFYALIGVHLFVLGKFGLILCTVIAGDDTPSICEPVDVERFDRLPSRFFYPLAFVCGLFCSGFLYINYENLSPTEAATWYGCTIGSAVFLFAVGRLIELVQQIRDKLFHAFPEAIGRN